MVNTKIVKKNITSAMKELEVAIMDDKKKPLKNNKGVLKKKKKTFSPLKLGFSTSEE